MGHHGDSDAAQLACHPEPAGGPRAAAERGGDQRELSAEVLLGKKHAEKYFPVFATFFVFIIICNYSGILPGAGHLTGFAVPTACLSVTAGLGVIAFFTTHVIGIREKGLGHYLASFCKPLILVVLMLPLNLLEQFIRPASLALRLACRSS